MSSVFRTLLIVQHHPRTISVIRQIRLYSSEGGCSLRVSRWEWKTGVRVSRRRESRSVGIQGIVVCHVLINYSFKNPGQKEWRREEMLPYGNCDWPRHDWIDSFSLCRNLSFRLDSRGFLILLVTSLLVMMTMMMRSTGRIVGVACPSCCTGMRWMSLNGEELRT